MNIVYISTVELPSRYASTVHIVNMVVEMARLGHRVTLFSPNINPDYDKNKLAHFYDLIPNFRLARFRLLRIQQRIPLFKNFITPELAYYRYLQLLRPSLIYIRDHAVNRFAALVSKLNVPFILEIHLPKQSADIDLLLSDKNLIKVVVISSSLKSELIRLHPNLSNKIQVHHDGAQLRQDYRNLSMNAVSAPKTEESKRFTGVYIGNLYPGKCMEELVEFAPKLEGEVNFLIYGGQEADVLRWRQNIASKSISNIHLLGYLSPSELFERIKDVDFFIAPFSKTVTQGTGLDLTPWMSPLKIFEYMALHRPIVCTDLPVIREVLMDDYNALLCEPGNPSSWVRAILRLKQNRSLGHRISAQAYKDLKENYTWSQRAGNILADIHL